MSIGKSLNLRNGFVLTGELDVWFIRANDVSLSRSFEKMHEVGPDGYSIYIHGLISGVGVGPTNDQILLKIHFTKTEDGYSATIEPNFPSELWYNIWTNRFRGLLSSFLSHFIGEHMNRIDNHRISALTNLVDDINVESLIQSVAGKVKNLKRGDLDKNESLRYAFHQLVEQLP